MSKYIKLEDAEKVLENTIRVMQGFEEPIERAIIDLPTIEIVHCEECMWYNDCLQIVMCIDRTATALRWCSDGERNEE